jgi:hypothetical protein
LAACAVNRCARMDGGSRDTRSPNAQVTTARIMALILHRFRREFEAISTGYG